MMGTTRSVYHDTATLSRFSMKDYKFGGIRKGYKDDGVQFKSDKFTNLGQFYNMVTMFADEAASPELVQVCYGGIFAASYSNIKRKDDSIWNGIELALSRGDNIEEGHFMERSWGRLLATPLEMFQVEAIWNHTRTIMEGGQYHGLLYKP